MSPCSVWARKKNMDLVLWVAEHTNIMPRSGSSRSFCGVEQKRMWGRIKIDVHAKNNVGLAKQPKFHMNREKKMFKIYLVSHSLKSGKVSWCVLMLWCIKTHLKSAREILYYKYLLFNVHSCKKDSLYAVEWDSECQAGLQNSCRWCSFQSRLKPHWAHQNHQELEAFRRVVIF